MESIKVINISKSFGIREIFKDVSFDLKRGERLALIGANGGGKSTLVKCLLGYEEIDSGYIVFSDGATVGYLEQDVNLGERTLREEVNQAWQDVHDLQARWQKLTTELSTRTPTDTELDRLATLQERLEWLGGYDYEHQSQKIIYGLGFTEADMDKPASAFSGGQKTRINLAKALVRQPDFLFLDEPTNHLDMNMLEWLEKYLASYGGGLLLISHDRYFLDRVATGILELENGKTTIYRGNYSRYLTQKEAAHKAAQRAYEKQQAHIKETEAYIDKYRAGIKSKMARGRQSQLDRLERLEAPEQVATLRFSFPKAKQSADKVLVMHDVTVGYGEHTVLQNIQLLIRQGDAVALIGANGAGKSTLLKAVMGELDSSGQIDIGNRVQIGYFSQEHEELHEHWTAMEEIINDFSLTEEEARGALGHFLFRGDAVFSRIGDMSGGERARLALLKLFLGGYNFLILDEPTNHLDIPTREVVEQALADFAGTYLVISHDRYFLDKLAKRTILLEDGHLIEYIGNYSYYKAKEKEKTDLAALQAAEAPQTQIEKRKSSSSDVGSDSSQPRVFSKNTVKNDYMREKYLENIETTISRLEATAKMYEVQLNSLDASQAYDEYMQIAEELKKTQDELTQAYEKWEALMD